MRLTRHNVIFDLFDRDIDDDESNRDMLPPDPPVASTTMEFKRGYLMRKCTIEAGGKKSKLLHTFKEIVAGYL